MDMFVNMNARSVVEMAFVNNQMEHVFKAYAKLGTTDNCVTLNALKPAFPALIQIHAPGVTMGGMA